MKYKISQDRRNFIKSLSGLFISTQLLRDSSSFPMIDDKTNLWSLFTEEENKLIKSSSLAEDILHYPEQGLSCAGSVLTSALKYLGKGNEISHTASSFGGGIGRSDLCGLLTGGHMAIGVAAGMIHKDVKPRQQYAREISNQYWDWWESLAPIHCKDLRPKYDKEGYARMLQRVAVKVGELIKPAVSA